MSEHDPDTKRSRYLDDSTPPRPRPEQTLTSPGGRRRPWRRWVKRRARVLFFTANARHGVPLKLDKEYRKVINRLRTAKHRDGFELLWCGASRLEDVQSHLAEYKPDIVHFAGHGDDDRGIILLDDDDTAMAVSPEALRRLFDEPGGGVSLVVINACFSHQHAQALQGRVGLAIGMNDRVDDDEAVAFAGAFYYELAQGSTVGRALEVGKAFFSTQSGDPGGASVVSSFGADPTKQRFAPASGAPPIIMELAKALTAFAVGWALATVVIKAFVRSALYSSPAPVCSQPAYLPPPPPPSPGMVRIEGAKVRVDAFDERAPPPECLNLAPKAEESCTLETYPARTVDVGDFEIDAAEVTNQQFAAWLDRNYASWSLDPHRYGYLRAKAPPQNEIAWACDEKRFCNRQKGECPPCEVGGLTVSKEGRVRARDGFARRPVIYVSWYAANDYCVALGKRLPDDAEWQLAAKGKEGRRFAWGADPPRPLEVAFNGRGSAKAGSRDVKSSHQDHTPDGVFDLAGNVAEWVDAEGGGQKVARGGSWNSMGPCHLLNTSCALHAPKDVHWYDLGFRCAREVTPP